MAKICKHVYGLDVAPGMRELAAAQACQRGIDNVEFLSSLPEQVTVDWINSYIVFQHILPRAGYSLIQLLLSKLNPGGYVSMQITFAHDKRGFPDLDRDLAVWQFDGEALTVIHADQYETGKMSMYDYDLNKVLWLFTTSGIRDINLHYTDHGGVLGFWTLGRRDQ